MGLAMTYRHPTLTLTDERNGSWNTACRESAIVGTVDGQGKMQVAQERLELTLLPRQEGVPFQKEMTTLEVEKI
jgi:hypothetical protein